MDGGGEGGEFQDWEVVVQQQKSDDDSASESTDPVHNSTNDLQEIDDVAHQSEGMIQTDYFSMDHHPSRNKFNTSSSNSRCVSEVGSENSDNPSWIDPNSETIRYPPKKDSGEFWSDSGSDRSDYRKFNEFEGDNDKLQVGFDGIEEMSGVKMKTFLEVDSSSMKVGDMEIGSESCCVENDNMEVLDGEKCEKESVESVEMVERKVEAKAEEEEKKSVVWWKVPIEFLRYCVFRASPVWTLSVAAAVMGFVILGRRLYKMKKKTRGLELKVTMDDKKISQFMSRAARLNEAFSVVKRVPAVRPSLPAVGVTPWPVMSLR